MGSFIHIYILTDKFSSFSQRVVLGVGAASLAQPPYIFLELCVLLSASFERPPHFLRLNVHLCGRRGQLIVAFVKVTKGVSNVGHGAAYLVEVVHLGAPICAQVHVRSVEGGVVLPPHVLSARLIDEVVDHENRIVEDRRVARETCQEAGYVLERKNAREGGVGVLSAR